METKEAVEEDLDCEMYQGTGIGYSHEEHSCGHCAGRGYQLKKENDGNERIS